MLWTWRSSMSRNGSSDTVTALGRPRPSLQPDGRPPQLDGSCTGFSRNDIGTAPPGRERPTAPSKGSPVKYVILMHVDPDVLASLSEEQGQAIGEGHQEFIDAITASGEMMSTLALGDPSQSIVVRASQGAAEAVDGPFTASKGFIGGYYLVDVESKGRAIELAKQIPDALIEGLALEVRPVVFSR